MGITSSQHTGESADERFDRNIIELLQELRVAGIGVQVLIGFLLSLPFTTRFSRLHDWQQNLYLASLGLAVTATVLLMGPVAYHRLVFRHGKRPNLVRAANVMAITGLITVSLAMCTAVAVVSTYVAGTVAGLLMTALLGCLFWGLWFAFPLTRR